MKFRAFLLLIFLSNLLNATKIGDVASVVGVRENQLIGYGLVVGLKGSGDGTTSAFTLQSIANMLQTVGVKIKQSDIKSKNTAAVMVTANLPSFARQGDKIDITISSLGDAKSLQGGTLLMTALKGVDGEIYAVAQGAITLGGNSEDYHSTVATLPNGALVEKEVLYDIYNQNFADLSLKNSSFKNASHLQNSINSKFHNSAVATNPRTIRLNKPENLSMVEFLASVLSIDIDYTAKEKIIIDERTGTIVSGINVSVDPVIITHGDIVLKIEPQSYYAHNQNQNSVDLGDETLIDGNTNTLNIENKKTTIANITRALSKLGASPQDIIAILQNLKRVGAIHVDLEII